MVLCVHPHNFPLNRWILFEIKILEDRRKNRLVEITPYIYNITQ